MRRSHYYQYSSLSSPKGLQNWTLGDARMTQEHESGKLLESWVKHTFSAEHERGEGITGQERGVQY